MSAGPCPSFQRKLESSAVPRERVPYDGSGWMVRHHPTPRHQAPEMRLWSLHPKYLDPPGLVALWREALLAKAVLRGETRGYRHHPQLLRFSSHPQPRLAINAYLAAVHAEATQRGYRFDHSKLGAVLAVEPIAVSSGQLAHEWSHLQDKLSARSPAVHARWTSVVTPACHPLFRRRAGPVAPWERA